MQTVSVPIEIRQILESSELVITWGDGFITRIKDVELRRACRCVECRRASGVQGMKGLSEDIRILAIVPIGVYAVQLCFDDQHDKGIFPWAYLRQLGDSVALTHASPTAKLS